ncbi:hypothetical protein Dimus_004498 [Dionaea muscipula]
MEFGQVGLDVLGGSAGNGSGCSLSPGHESKDKCFSGSGLQKNERSEVGNEDAKPAASKAANNGDFPSSTMLSFSCPNMPEAYLLRKNGGFGGRSSETSALPYFHQIASAYGKHTGYASGSVNGGMYVLSGVKGPFTPSQWLELQHQALIYKHFITNEPIPPNLLIPIRKALESARFSNFNGDPLRPNAFAWGPFHLGFSNSTDPEPGRCRRTDGKKWRCTRDAVADQKYCERHINRGRHRSRKPVEGQADNSISGAATGTTTKLMPMVSSPSASLPVGSASDGFNIANQQYKNWQPDASDSPASPLVKRMLAGHNPGVQDSTQSSFLPAEIDLNLRENIFSAPKHHNPCEELAPCDFGVPSTESLLNISHKTSSICGSYASSHDLSNLQSESQNSLCHDIVSRSAIPWPESDRSQQQSIPMPIHPLDFMSSNSSPTTNDKVTGSPLRSSQEHDLVQMGLGVGSNSSNEPKHQQAADWIPISWESSLGGPLGEVLHSTKGNFSDHRDTSASGLNPLSKSWDRSPHLSSSSPTGILQKIPFGSVSNSSTTASCTQNSKNPEGASLCHDPHSKVIHSFSLPLL